MMMMMMMVMMMMMMLLLTMMTMIMKKLLVDFCPDLVYLLTGPTAVSLNYIFELT